MTDTQAWAAAARGKFDELVARLEMPVGDHMTHADLEDLLAGQGREVLRQLLQDRMELRALRERSSTPGACLAPTPSGTRPAP